VQLPPDPVVYLAEVRTVGWPESWNGEMVFHRLTVALCHVPRSVVLSANVTFRPVTALMNVMETGIFCRRYFKFNNSTVNEYFLTKFCGGFFKDIFII